MIGAVRTAGENNAMVNEALWCLAAGLLITIVALAILWPRVAYNAAARAWHLLWWCDVCESRTVTSGELMSVAVMGVNLTFDEIYDHIDEVSYEDVLGAWTMEVHGRRARKWWRWMRCKSQS